MVCQIRIQMTALKHALPREALQQIGDVDNIETEKVSCLDKPLWNAPAADSRYDGVSPVVGQDKRKSAEEEQTDNARRCPSTS